MDKMLIKEPILLGISEVAFRQIINLFFICFVKMVKKHVTE